MTDLYKEGQCQYFVVRKKRLCRMTVKPGRHFCGEHEPQPAAAVGDDKEDLRVPCPYDPKHTCFASKLEKHLRICNAREQELPEYITHNVNAPTDEGAWPRMLLNDISTEKISNVIDKINTLFDELLKDNIMDLPDKPIHRVVVEEFDKAGRKESSLRHLRQVSRLLHLMEDEGMVQPDTCYIELGAGKGRLAAMVWSAWCAADDGDSGGVLLVERAALRHKRDNSTTATRLRADLAHVVLARVDAVRRARAAVGLAKHLCGVATDYALRSLCADGVVGKVAGVVLATCCHHRCDVTATVAAAQLRKLGITAEEFNIMLGIVSWATCGDGRSRNHRGGAPDHHDGAPDHRDGAPDHHSSAPSRKLGEDNDIQHNVIQNVNSQCNGSKDQNVDGQNLSKHNSNNADQASDTHNMRKHLNNHNINQENANTKDLIRNDTAVQNDKSHMIMPNETQNDDLENSNTRKIQNITSDQENLGTKKLQLDRAARERVGRRAKALIDWGRVLFLRGHGFEARLVHYVPTAVSLENFCIVAKKKV